MFIGDILAVDGLAITFLQMEARAFLGSRQLGESGKTAQLKTGGLYRFVRHPLYTFGLAFIWLYPHRTESLLVLNVALTIYSIIGAVFEERKLRREFGHAYSDYAAGMPMLILL